LKVIHHILSLVTETSQARVSDIGTGSIEIFIDSYETDAVQEHPRLAQLQELENEFTTGGHIDLETDLH
jgi:hypothetical protein